MTDKAKTLVDKELLGDGIPAKPRRRSRGFMRGLLRFLIPVVVLLAVLFVTAPRILSSNSVRDIVVEKINAAMPDTSVAIGNWRWRWLTPCRIDNIAVKMRDGSFSCAVDSISTSVGIMEWIRSPRHLGSISVNNPTEIGRASCRERV